MKRLLLALICCVPIPFAQAITTGPLSTLPVNNPLMLMVLAVLLVVVAFGFFKRKSLQLAVMPMVVLATAAVVWQVPALKAQVMLAFTNPSGETLPITVDYDGDSQSFAAADFTNSSGETLTIRQILLPTFEQCFPDGLEPLTPPPAEVFTPCNEGQVLRNNASCRVDVHSVCADWALTAATTLSALTQNLALSVNNPAADPALVGNPRLIRMENTGSVPASNVQVNTSALPAGTAITNNTCTGTLNAGATCDITITPGGTASADAGSNACTTAPGTEPVPSTVTVTADNAPSLDVSLLVLGYGCIYQGGYVFAIDDSTSNTSSIGGKVAALTDEASSQWATVFDDTGAYSLTDGGANTTALATPVGQYPPAQACLNSSDQGFTDWYLPAICELGRFVGLGNNAGCGTTNPNVYTTLHTNNLGSFASDFYFSSTEFSGAPQSFVWGQDFASGGQIITAKALITRSHCVRAFTL